MAQLSWRDQARIVCILAIVLQCVQIYRNVWLFINPAGILNPRDWYDWHELMRVTLPIRILTWTDPDRNTVLEALPKFMSIHFAYSLAVILLTIWLWMGTTSYDLGKVTVWIWVNAVIFGVEVLMELLTIQQVYGLTKESIQRETSMELPSNFLVIELCLAILVVFYRSAFFGIVERFQKELGLALMGINLYEAQDQTGLEEVSVSQPQFNWGPNAVHPSENRSHDHHDHHHHNSQSDYCRRLSRDSSGSSLSNSE